MVRERAGEHDRYTAQRRQRMTPGRVAAGVDGVGGVAEHGRKIAIPAAGNRYWRVVIAVTCNLSSASIRASFLRSRSGIPGLEPFPYAHAVKHRHKNIGLACLGDVDSRKMGLSSCK